MTRLAVPTVNTWNKNVHAQRVGVAVVMQGVWLHRRTVEIPGQSGLKQSSGTRAIRDKGKKSGTVPEILGQLATMVIV